jgi:hypothetical protein
MLTLHFIEEESHPNNMVISMSLDDAPSAGFRVGVQDGVHPQVLEYEIDMPAAE